MADLTCTSTSNSVLINLSELTGCKEEYNEFKTNKKRIFSKNGDSYIEEWKHCYQLFGQGFLNSLVDFRVKLENGEINDDNLNEHLDTVFNSFYVEALRYCDEEYKVEIVIGSNNPELQFDRTHCLIILANAKISRAAIPLITEYIKTLEDANGDYINKRFLNYFIHSMKKIENAIEGRHINMENKLRKLIESRVFGTEYSDSVVWGYLRNVGTSPVEFIQPLLRKIYIDIIPKLSLEENCINFLHVVIKKQLQYQFHQKIPLAYETVNSSIEPDEASVFDIEVSKFNQNEIYSPLISLAIQEMFKKVKGSIANDIEVTEEELIKYEKFIRPNKEKTILYLMTYGRFIEDHEMLYRMNQRTFAMLILYLYKIFKKVGFNELAKVVLYDTKESEMTVAKFKLTKKYLTQIKTSERYTKLRDEKFSNVITKFDKNNIIFTLLENCLKSTRVTLPVDGEEQKDVEIDPDILADELIKLVDFIS